MEQDLARGCPDKPSSPRASGAQRTDRPPQRQVTGAAGCSSGARYSGRSACNQALRALYLLAHHFFSFPPHIPTDIVVSWRVRRAGPAQVGRFRHAHLYGKFQKSTAATQTVPRPRTRISVIATRGRMAPGSGWEAPAVTARSWAQEVRVQFGDLPYSPHFFW